MGYLKNCLNFRKGVEMFCPKCFDKLGILREMEKTKRTKSLMTDEGLAPYRVYKCSDCGEEIYSLEQKGDKRHALD